MSLTVTDFQKISNGTYNAGDITLTKSGKLDKVNNHVGILKGWNTKTVSASKTLEVKNAFVEALRNAGVNDDELANVRKDLGLPEGGGTKGLDLSTLKPLTRAQTRAILDRYKGTINGTLNRTVVSNRWEAHKAANDQNYINHFNVAGRTNQKTVEDRAAAQKALGKKIMDGGFGSLPKGVRNSPGFAELSADDKSRFASILASMLLKGGADVDGLAAEAMKKLLVSKYGRDLKNDAEKNLFKSLVGGMSATTDLSCIKTDVEAAKKAAAGAKLEFKSESDEMDKVTFDFARSDVYSKIINKEFKPNETAKGIGEALSEKENLNKIVSFFGAQVNKYGTLEVVGEPSYKLNPLKNGNTMLEFSFDAGIGGYNKTVGGRCTLSLEIEAGRNPPICGSKAEMELEPRLKFTDMDLSPETAEYQKTAEYHKQRILENVKSAAVKRNIDLNENNIAALEDQMADWGNLEPGQMQNFEAWILNDLSTDIDKCINSNSGTLTFDDQGFCHQFDLDTNRAQFTVDGKTIPADTNPQASSNKNVNDEIRKVLPSVADRKLITGLMNQATFAKIQYLIHDDEPPAHIGEKNAPLLRNLDPAGSHAVNAVPAESAVFVLSSATDSGAVRYDLKVDKEKNTATLTATADYKLTLNEEMFPGLGEDGSGMKLGKASYSYDIQITGLNSGSPKIVSVGFSQHITALDA